ncbi:SNF2-related protein, partial [Escherichia coli]|nr:SNF2-related protein [Escherichia coli]
TPKRIKDAIKPFTLRRLKADVLKELPPKICNVIQLELTENQRLSYEKAEEEGTRELSEKGNSATVQHVLALITKLKQICNIDPKTGESC